jgi:hypothetical protein
MPAHTIDKVFRTERKQYLTDLAETLYPCFFLKEALATAGSQHPLLLN